MKKRVLAVCLVLSAILILISCGSSGKKATTSGLSKRVLASQGVSSTTNAGGLVFINGINDTLPRISPINAGLYPSLMAVSPSRNLLIAFDSGTNNVVAVNTVTEAAIGHIQLPGPTQSMIVPTASQVGYAAVPSATVTGFTGVGAIEVMNLAGSITTSIAVPSAQTVISDGTGGHLLAFNGTNSVYIIAPGAAVPPADLSCLSAPNLVCTVVSGFDQPVYGFVSGSTAYILNCGPECGGTTASVAVLDLSSMTITATIPVDGATWGFLSGSTLYVAGNSPTNNACSGQTTAATKCGRLDAVDLGAGTVTSTYVITDGYHNRMDMSSNGQLFIGSHDCTNIGNVNNPNGEVRGCLTILNTTNNSIVVPPDNGDVTGLQSFSSRYIEYVAEGGALRVYDTTRNVLLVNDFLPQGTINIVGYVGDVKAIDFF